MALVASLSLLVRYGMSRVSRQAEVGDLRLNVRRARWLVDQMEHGQRYGRPPTMMEGMPPHGLLRFNVEFVLFNAGRLAERFKHDELRLHSEGGRVYAPAWAQWPTLTLRPGQSIHTLVYFDVEEQDDALKLTWHREGAHGLVVTYAPGHHGTSERTAPVRWPPMVDWLPPGSAERGKRIFEQRYGCVACHGDPDLPGSETVGPHLASIGEAAGSRVSGQSAAQYLYASLLRPSEFVPERCAKSLPCRRPSQMPPFAALLSVEEMSDLLTYLLQLR